MTRYDRDHRPHEIGDSKVRRPVESTGAQEASGARGRGTAGHCSHQQPPGYEPRSGYERYARNARRSKHRAAGRERNYVLGDSEPRTPADIGTFRVLKLGELVTHRHGGDPVKCRRDLDNRKQHGIIVRRINGPQETVYLTLALRAAAPLSVFVHPFRPCRLLFSAARDGKNKNSLPGGTGD